MTGIILCPKAEKSLEIIAGSGSAALIDLCGRTALERTLDNLIAAGLNKAYVLYEKHDKILQNTIKRYDNADKIIVELAGADMFNEDTLLICDALSCSDSSVVELIKQAGQNTCVTDKSGEFVFAKIGGNRVKQLHLTDEQDVLLSVPERLKVLDQIKSSIEPPCDVKGFLACQAKMLCGKESVYTAQTNSNFIGATIIPPVFIGKNVTINSGAVVGCGSVISDGARIGKGSRIIGAYIGKCAVVGKNCSIENSFVSTGSHIMNRVWVADGAVIRAGSCIKSNSHISENSVVSAYDRSDSDVCFLKEQKPLDFDDDGICSLFDGTTDVSSYSRLGKAVGTVLSLNERVVCGHSAVENSEVLTQAFICGVRSAGIDVLDLSVCTIGQLGYAVQRTDSRIGVFIGVDANCDIRFVDRCGLPITAKLEEDIAHCFDSQIFRSAAVCEFGACISAESEKYAYCRRLSEIMPKRLRGINVSVRTNDIIAAAICDRVFSPANDLNGENIIFQLSNDLTAANAYCESTGNVRWEHLCLLGCKIMFAKNIPVSLPYSIPSAAEKMAQHLQGRVYRYCTVSAGEKDASSREIACEPDAGFVRDALLLTALICRYLNEERISLKKALADVDRVCCLQRYINISSECVSKLENTTAVGDEGVFVCDRNTRVFVRPSKNKNSLMAFAESTKTEFAAAFCDTIFEKLRKINDLHK